MERRARESLAHLCRRSAGWMPARIGRLSAGVGRSHAVTIRRRPWWQGQCVGYEHCDSIPERSQLNGPGLGWLFAKLLLQHPSQSQQTASGVRLVMPTFCEVTQGVGDTWATCPTLLRGIWDRSRRAGFCSCGWLLAHVWLSCWWGERLPTSFL